MAVDLAKLAAMHDPSSRDSFLTLYADITDPRYGDALDRRAREIRAAISKQDEKEFDDAWSRARRLLGTLVGQRAKGAVIFVAPAHGVEEAHALSLPIPTRVVLDSSPYVRPLARFQDENEPFLLVVADSESAAVYLVEAGKADLEHRRRLDLIGRHKKGGMSQMRYQRHRQGIKDRLMEETIDQLDRLVQADDARRIVLAGPGPAKRQLEGRLPLRLKELVIGVEDTDADLDLELARYVALARATDDSARLATERVKRELRHGELALTGAFDVARAARDGRVDVLLVEKDRRVGGAKCEAHQSFFPSGSTCSCGSRGTEVDLLNEAIEGAARSEADVEFVPPRDEFVSGVGGVAALLRW